MEDWITLIGLVIFWGSSFAMTKIAVTGLMPEWTVALRLIIGAVIVYGIMRWRGLKLPTDGTSLLWFAWLGLIGSVVPFFLISWATLHIASGLAGVLMATVPIVVVFMAHFALPDEPLTWAKGLGFVIGFAGVVVLIGPDFLGGIGGRGVVLLAELAAILAAISYALQSVTARRSPAMDPLQKAAGVLSAGALAATLHALVFAPVTLAHASPAALLSAVGLGIFPTALAGIMLFRLLDRAGAGFVSLSNYLIPPYAFVLGVLALGEPFYWRALAGLAVILAGIAISQWGSARPAETPHAPASPGRERRRNL